MYWLTAFNFLEIQNAKQSDKAQRRLDDLKDEAQHLQQQGVPVPSWRDFNNNVEQKKPNYGRNIAVGIAGGAAILGGIGLLITAPPVAAGAAVSGGLLGGLFGGYHETENSQRNAKVEAYGKLIEAAKNRAGKIVNYASLGIDESKLSANDKKALSYIVDTGIPKAEVFPEQIIAANAAPAKEAGCGCGGR